MAQLEILGGLNTNNPIGFVCTKTNILKDGSTVLSYRIYEKDCEFKLCAFIKTTVTTNSYSVMEYLSENGWIQMDGINRFYPEYPACTRSNPERRHCDIVKIKTLEFDYDGKHFSEQLSHETISTKRQRRVTTEEWVDELHNKNNKN